MITSISIRPHPFAFSRGFTLIETLLAAASAMVVVVAVMMAYSMTTRGFAAAGNYSDMERDARLTLDTLGRDARQATGLTAFAASDVSLAVATDFAANGSVAGSKIVRYFRGLGVNSNLLYRADNGQTNAIAHSVSSLRFIEYDRNLVTNGIQPSDCKLLQIDITMRKYTLETPNSEQILSARVMLRNKVLP
jgi:hypothetical protein